jgi:hypothetical protein
MPIVDDLSVEVEGPLMAGQRPTTERADGQGPRNAKGITRPLPVVAGTDGNGRCWRKTGRLDAPSGKTSIFPPMDTR